MNIIREYKALILAVSFLAIVVSLITAEHFCSEVKEYTKTYSGVVIATQGNEYSSQQWVYFDNGRVLKVPPNLNLQIGRGYILTYDVRERITHDGHFFDSYGESFRWVSELK